MVSILVSTSVKSSVMPIPEEVLETVQDGDFNDTTKRQVAHLLNVRGDKSMKEVDFRYAARNFLVAVKLVPDDANSRGNLGAALASLRVFGEAEANLQRAIELNPGKAMFRMNLNVLRQQMDNSSQYNLESLEETYKAAIEQHPTSFEAHENLGEVEDRRGNPQLAVESYRRALKLLPTRSMLYRKIGDSLIRGEKLAEAKEYFQLAIKTDPTSASFPLGFIAKLPEGARHYKEWVQEEARLFRAQCQDIADINPVASKLIPILAEIREIENTLDWVIQMHMESVVRFDMTVPSTLPLGKLKSETAAYGALWFSAWQYMVRQSIVGQTLLEGHSESMDSRPMIFIAGSALGEQCLFAVSWGFRCIGWEMLCDSMVAPARKLFEKHGLDSWVTFHCGDASEAEGLQNVKFAFVNDLTWPPDVRHRVHQNLAKQLPDEALIASYKENEHHLAGNNSGFEWPKGFVFMDRVEAKMSWGEEVIEVRVQKSKRLEEILATPPDDTEL